MKLSLQNCETNSRNRLSDRQRTVACFKLVFLALCFSLSTNAQTLFTYGKQKVSKDEFLKAYRKNNSDTSANRMSYSDYLELYTRFRLKVQAAIDAGLDTTTQQKNEVQSFRYQLAENFLKEDASIDILVNEAIERSLKDIHISHLYIPLSANASPDSVNVVKEKINDAYERLQNGEPFDNVASTYAHGSIGYITTFVLPYDAESKIYATRPGKHSVPFRTSSGFHIVRNNWERKAVGKMRAAQILLAFPPSANDSRKESISARADSIHKALLAGADFAQLAQQLSDDHLSYQTGGEMPAFGVGQYDTTFEKMAFTLENDGDISQPFSTAFGYHIVKRLQRIPVIEDRNNNNWKEVIRERVLQSDRMEVAQSRLIENLRQIIRKDAPPAVLANDSAVLDYYRNNLEKYNSEFAEQLKEFSEGNLLFTIMQKKVWDAAIEDTSGLIAYYEQNKQKYKWEASADALILTCLIPDSVESVQQRIKSNFQNWRDIVEASNGIIQADSGRFELSQIPVVGRTNFTEGLVSAPVVNEQDSSMTFAYIIKLHNTTEPKAFADAKGAVINDYQVFLEEKWIAELKKKYAVKVNRRALPFRNPFFFFNSAIHFSSRNTW